MLGYKVNSNISGMFDFELFKKEVLEHYHIQKEQGKLHIYLENPSPANLRDYTLKHVREGLSKDDERVLNDFFDEGRKFEHLGKAIQKCDLGKLKSLQNFITGHTKNPSELIVKVLAILADFQPRPYQRWREERAGKAPDGDTEAAHVFEKQDSHKREKNRDALPLSRPTFTKNLLWAAAGAVGLSVGVVLLLQYKDKGCAYWNGTEYVLTACEDHKSEYDVFFVTRETDLTLKKITRPDTLSAKDEHKVWYYKHDSSKVEFFTGPGYHPVYKNKPLKAATKYIITKYGKSNKY